MKKQLFVVAALVLTGCSAQADPIPTVTEVTPGPTVTTPGPTVTTVKNKMHIPQQCLDALDAADELITVSGEALQLVPEVLSAYQYEDLDAMTAAGDELGGLLDDMDAAGPTYVDAKEACRGAAE